MAMYALTSQITTNTHSVYALHSAYIPGPPFVARSEAIVPQDMLLPGVGVEGVEGPSTEDTLVLLSDCASGHGRLGTVETIVVVWD